MRTTSCPAIPPDRRPTGRFPRLDAGPLPGVLGHPSGPNTAPLLPLRGRARGNAPSARITSPLRGHVMRGLRPPLTDGLDARVCDGVTPCPAASRRGRGAAPGCPSRRGRRHALGPRLRPPAPPAVLVPHGAGASNGTARRRPLVPPRSGGPLPTLDQRRPSKRRPPRIKLRATGYVEERAQYPAATRNQHQAGVTGAAPGVTTGGATGAGDVCPKVQLCRGEHTRPRRLKRRAGSIRP